MHPGNGHTLGEVGGEQNHTLLISEIPVHIHTASASNTTASTNLPAGNLLGNSTPNNLYGPVQNLGAMVAGTVTNVGGSQPHPNMQPYLTISFCIALQGIFPSQN
jgi:microcystin-dependent protein